MVDTHLAGNDTQVWANVRGADSEEAIHVYLACYSINTFDPHQRRRAVIRLAVGRHHEGTTPNSFSIRVHIFYGYLKTMATTV
ncbi:MAG TPA: hypothetical protein VIX37_03350 [Candidatus Sulfotelmatobacter sp.]